VINNCLFQKSPQGECWLIVLTTKSILLKPKPSPKRNCEDISDPNIGCLIEDSMKKGEEKESSSPKAEVLTESREW